MLRTAAAHVVAALVNTATREHGTKIVSTEDARRQMKGHTIRSLSPLICLRSIASTSLSSYFVTDALKLKQQMMRNDVGEREIVGDKFNMHQLDM